MRSAILIMIFFFSGCGGGPSVDWESHFVADSAGIEIVESYSPAWAEGHRIEAQPRIRIGREDEGPYQFGFLTEGLLLGDGTILIPEGRTQELRFYNQDGQHIRTLGRRGEGPGEFQNLSGVFEFAPDSIAAFDWRLRKTSVFSVTSGYVRAIPNQVEGNFSVFGVLKDGPFLLLNRGRGFRPDLSPGLQWTGSDIVAMDPTDGSSEVVATLPIRQQLVEPGGDTGLIIPPLYSIQAVAEDGFYWATANRYEIGFYDATGNLRRSLRRPVQPQPVEQSMIDRWVETNLENRRRYEGAAAVPGYRRSYEEALVGEHVPFFGRAFVDGDQRLWVSGPVWPSLGGPVKQWSVFSKSGIWLGDVEAPDGVRIVHSRGDLVLGIWFDEMEVPFVQLHRLVTGSE